MRRAWRSSSARPSKSSTIVRILAWALMPCLHARHEARSVVATARQAALDGSRAREGAADPWPCRRLQQALGESGQPGSDRGGQAAGRCRGRPRATGLRYRRPRRSGGRVVKRPKPPKVIKTCGDAGGRTNDGRPCTRLANYGVKRVQDRDGRCKEHNAVGEALLQAKKKAVLDLFRTS